MQKAIQKAKIIQKVTLIYKNNPSLLYQQAVQIYKIALNLSIN